MCDLFLDPPKRTPEPEVLPQLLQTIPTNLRERSSNNFMPFISAIDCTQEPGRVNQVVDTLPLPVGLTPVANQLTVDTTISYGVPSMPSVFSRRKSSNTPSQRPSSEYIEYQMPIEATTPSIPSLESRVVVTPEMQVGSYGSLYPPAPNKFRISQERLNKALLGIKAENSMLMVPKKSKKQRVSSVDSLPSARISDRSSLAPSKFKVTYATATKVRMIFHEKNERRMPKKKVR